VILYVCGDGACGKFVRGVRVVRVVRGVRGVRGKFVESSEGKVYHAPDPGG
jgi:hypothetical protein